MSRLKWFGVTLGILVAVAVIAFKSTFPSYPYRYRLHLTLELEGRAHTGSSVIQVNWECGPKYSGLGRCAARLAGEATVIDLGPRGALVATLRTGDTVIPIPDGAVDAVFLCANAFGNQSTDEELPVLSRLSGRRSLSPLNFPRLLWFPDAADSKSARRITLESISSTIDPTARVTEAFVEITRDPVVIDISSKLPWYPALEKAQKGKAVTSWPGQFQLVYNMFVGEDS